MFLAGNDLPARFSDGFTIAELGFGTGLNFLATLQMWRETGQSGTLHFTSFEAFPMDKSDMARALDAFDELGELVREFLDAWAGADTTLSLAGAQLTVISGDARKTVQSWNGCADAWFLDGFSPAKNPELWEEDLLRSVAAHTQPTGTAATYSAAGHVRRSLCEAGFQVERFTGFGRKRHMTIARKMRTA